MSVPRVVLSNPESSTFSSLASRKIFLMFLGFLFLFSHCKNILGMPVTETALDSLCQGLYQVHGYFRDNEINFFTVLAFPELLKIV